MKKIFLSLLVMLFSIIIIAQNSGINYQAVIRDANNNIIINSPVNLKISILNNINGDIVYSENFNLTTNNFGLINTVIGSGNVETGDFDEIDWSKKYFVKIDLDAENTNHFETISITKLNSVPYSCFSDKSYKAIYADTALYSKKSTIAQHKSFNFGTGNGFSTINTNGYIVKDLSKTIINFNKSSYNNIDSIIFSVIIKSENSNSATIVELYNLNTNSVISNSKISTNETNFTFVSSKNIADFLPDNNSNITIRLKSENNNSYSYISKANLDVYSH